MAQQIQETRLTAEEIHAIAIDILEQGIRMKTPDGTMYRTIGDVLFGLAHELEQQERGADRG